MIRYFGFMDIEDDQSTYVRTPVDNASEDALSDLVVEMEDTSLSTTE